MAVCMNAKLPGCVGVGGNDSAPVRIAACREGLPANLPFADFLRLLFQMR
jgi:hypothetical protein